MKKKKNRKLSYLFVVIETIVLIFHLPLPVSADMGPKPTITIQFEGYSEGEEFYAALLGIGDGMMSQFYGDSKIQDSTDKNVEKVLQYQAEDDYVVQFFSVFHFTEDQTRQEKRLSFQGTYQLNYPYKVLIYYPMRDTFYVSEIIEEAAYDGIYRIDLSQSNEILQVTTISTKLTMIPGIIIRCILTVIIELGIALLYKYRSKQNIILIVVVNVITNLTLNTILTVAEFEGANILYFFSYYLLEFIVFLLEMIIYMIFLKVDPQNRKRRIFAYTLVANHFSYLMGFIPVLFI